MLPGITEHRVVGCGAPKFALTPRHRETQGSHSFKTRHPTVGYDRDSGRLEAGSRFGRVDSSTRKERTSATRKAPGRYITEGGTVLAALEDSDRVADSSEGFVDGLTPKACRET